MFCVTCGGRLRRDDHFCPSCGARSDGRNRPEALPSRRPQVLLAHRPARRLERRTIAILAVYFVAMAALVGVSKLMGGSPVAAPPASTPADITPTPSAVTETAVATQAVATAITPPAGVVVFADPTVEAWIRFKYITKQGPITTGDMAGITTFEFDIFNDKDAVGTITTLDDLRHCTNLQILDVPGQPVTSIEGLRGLPHLTRVRMINCAVSDFSPLAGKQSLQYVRIDGNPVMNAEAVLSLPNLREFNASGITDISPLRTTHGLIGFHCEDFLKDYSPLLAHPNMKDLSLAGLSNNDFVSILGMMKGLGTFRIQNSSVEASSLNLLKGRSMYGLSLNNCGLTDISALAQLASVSDLRLTDNHIEDISPLAGLTMIDYCLDLRNNNIRDYSPLKNMKRLPALYVLGNPVTDDETLRELEKNGCKVYR